MRIMVTGPTGMLGRSVIKAGDGNNHVMIPVSHNMADIRDHLLMTEIIRREKPEVLINCAGITKYTKVETLEYFQINSMAPLKLSHICDQFGVHMVQISTDCVFNGFEGAPYTENSRHFSSDAYGMSKVLGELGDNHLTIRCSFIGLDGGLLNWVFEQEIEAPGFINSRWNGMSVMRAAEEIIWQASIETKGMLHIYGSDITKYDILCVVNDVFNLGLNIIPVEKPEIDRRLRTNRKEYTMALPPLKEQLEEML